MLRGPRLAPQDEIRRARTGPRRGPRADSELCSQSRGTLDSFHAAAGGEENNGGPRLEIRLTADWTAGRSGDFPVDIRN